MHVCVPTGTDTPCCYAAAWAQGRLSPRRAIDQQRLLLTAVRAALLRWIELRCAG